MAKAVPVSEPKKGDRVKPRINIESDNYRAGYDHGQNYVLNQQKHNGYTNYETWAVSLWIGNEQGSYQYWNEAAQEARDGDFADQDDRVCNLADRLKSEMAEGAPDLGATLWSDLLSAAISEVNWYEIAQHLLEE